jgi:curved DNA-binding protein CbpA
MVNDSHFEALGVNRNATFDEIKKAYRRQMKKWHPDRFQDKPDELLKAIEISKHINEAYHVLKDHAAATKRTIDLEKQKYPDSKSTSKRTGGKPDFHRVKVNSDKVWTIGYDAFTKILQVEFYDAGVYHYYDVPERIYTALMYANSVDDYLNTNITWKYHWEQVQPT